MQPYFFPYIGYFQLIGAVDLFVVYDNIKYTKKGWINRNRILADKHEAMISLPLKNDADVLHVRDRELAADFRSDKLLNKLKGAYCRAPYFDQVFPLLEKVLNYDDRNLFRFIHHSIVAVCEYLEITTPLALSSSIPIDHALKNQDKVIALCEAAGASVYVNPIGGTSLYTEADFLDKGI